MNGVEEKLDYLKSTKEQMRQVINANGGELDIDSPLDDYPAQVQHIVDTTIIPQSTLDELAGEAVDING